LNIVGVIFKCSFVLLICECSLCNKTFQVSEIEVKAAQLLKLIESLEDYMIQETTKKLTKDLNLAFAERGREESALPTDLWKRPVSVFNTISQFIYSVMTL